MIEARPTMTTAVERPGGTTFLGQAYTLLGAAVRIGDPAPDFSVIAADLSPVTLASSRGAVRLIASVPSLDTEICSLEAQRFNDEAAGLPGVTMLTVSVDLPFAQQRWSADTAAEAVLVTSDHRDLSFGLAYGVVIKELRLLARAVFVVDPDDIVVWAEYVADLGDHPRYAEALAAARTARG